MSPPRRGPFEGSASSFPGFADTFDYPPGPLVGAGPWVVNPVYEDGNVSPVVVVAGGVTYTTNDVACAWAPIPGFNPAAPWTATLSFTHDRTGPEDNPPCITLILGAPAEVTNGTNINISFGLDETLYLQLDYEIDGVPTLAASDANPCTSNAPHTLTITCDGATTFTAKLDDAVIYTGAIPPGAHCNPYLGLLLSGYGPADSVRITALHLT